MRKLIYIEWARGIAALLVVLHHITLDFPTFYHYEPFGNFFYFGMAGVDFFFVLSGFIIYYVHSRDSATFENVKKYMLKRLIRIYPPFLFVSGLLLIAYLLLPSLTDRSDLYDFGFVFKSFLLFPQEHPPLLTVSWTLVHEMFFYLLFVVLILNKRFGFFAFFVWFLLIVWYQVFVHDRLFPYSFYFSLHNLEFLFGVFVAYLLIHKKIEFSSKKLFIMIAIALAVFVLNGIDQDYHISRISSSERVLIYGFSAAVLVYGLTHIQQYIHKNNASKLLSLLGAASYSIYLIHVPLLSVLHRIALKMNLQSYLHHNILFLLLVLFAVAGGVIMHIIVEKPVTSYLRDKFV